MDQSLAYAGLGGDDSISKILKPDVCTIDMCKEAMLAVQVGAHIF